MANLNDFTFTQDSDVVATFNAPIENDTLVKTLNGNDSIESIIDSESEDFTDVESFEFSDAVFAFDNGSLDLIT